LNNKGTKTQRQGKKWLIHFFGLLRFAYGLLFGQRGLIWVDPRRATQATTAQPIKNKQSFFSEKNPQIGAISCK
jgi:hypothetical protein